MNPPSHFCVTVSCMQFTTKARNLAWQLSSFGYPAFVSMWCDLLSAYQKRVHHQSLNIHESRGYCGSNSHLIQMRCLLKQQVVASGKSCLNFFTLTVLLKNVCSRSGLFFIDCTTCSGTPFKTASQNISVKFVCWPLGLTVVCLSQVSADLFIYSLGSMLQTHSNLVIEAMVARGNC